MRVEDVFDVSSLRCYVVLNDSFCRCGYVEVRVCRAAVKVIDALQSIDVHGGVTSAVVTESPIDGVTVLTIGFDTAHCGDMPDVVEAYAASRRGEIHADKYTEICYHASKMAPGHAWTLEETAAEVRRLAEQIAAVLDSR